jgi:sucrose phosphorylase
LDTHDGIGIVDVQGLMSQVEIDRTIDGLYEKGSHAKRIYNTEAYNNLDLYQMNCTYYSALDCNDDSYICARILQFFTPGIPQVYYVGLLAGKNDIALVEKTKSGRSINRHNYTLEEIDEEIQQPVVQRLLRLMEFRNAYPAFDGDMEIEDSAENRVRLTWRMGACQATADIDLDTYANRIAYYDETRKRMTEVSF